jgi:hypothetical protein
MQLLFTHIERTHSDGSCSSACPVVVGGTMLRTEMVVESTLVATRLPYKGKEGKNNKMSFEKENIH